MARESRFGFVIFPPVSQSRPARLVQPLPGLQIPQVRDVYLAGRRNRRRRRSSRVNRRTMPPPRANCASADPLRQVHAVLDGLRLRLPEHGVVLDRGQPVGVSRGEIVAAAMCVALDEWFGAEFLQTGAGGHQGLTRTFGSGIRVLEIGFW